MTRVTAAGLVCTSCGSEPSRTGARYCDACGRALPGPESRAEFKQVTVLFADVVRSMDIAAVLDMERFREIMTELVERSVAVVQRYGGTVEFIGDGVMAVFGAPAALEDHAFRGCLAALAITPSMTCSGSSTTTGGSAGAANNSDTSCLLPLAL